MQRAVPSHRARRLYALMRDDPVVLGRLREPNSSLGSVLAELATEPGAEAALATAQAMARAAGYEAGDWALYVARATLAANPVFSRQLTPSQLAINLDATLVAWERARGMAGPAGAAEAEEWAWSPVTTPSTEELGESPVSSPMVSLDFFSDDNDAAVSPPPPPRMGTRLPWE